MSYLRILNDQYEIEPTIAQMVQLDPYYHEVFAEFCEKFQTTPGEFISAYLQALTDSNVLRKGHYNDRAKKCPGG